MPRPLPDFGLWTLDFGLAAASHHRLIPMVRKFADRGCIGLAVRKHPISRSNIHPLRGTHLPDFGRWTSDFGLAAASHRRLIPMVRKTPELGSHRGDEVDCLAPPLARLWTRNLGPAQSTHHATLNTFKFSMNYWKAIASHRAFDPKRTASNKTTFAYLPCLSNGLVENSFGRFPMTLNFAYPDQ